MRYKLPPLAIARFHPALPSFATRETKAKRNDQIADRNMLGFAVRFEGGGEEGTRLVVELPDCNSSDLVELAPNCVAKLREILSHSKSKKGFTASGIHGHGVSGDI